MNLSKTYNHQETEEKIYRFWEKNKFFTPKIPKNLKPVPFVISMPPPNVTGRLHIGHAMVVTLEDILTRYHRMKGEPTLWLPGTDHGGIATQHVVEKALKKEGKSKHDLGREKFINRVWEWKEKYGGEITQQIRRLGASCDWTRERFTLDEGLSEAVRAAFIHLYKKGLIYRGKYIVNWCSRCESTLSDDEVEYKKQKGIFYYLRYGPAVIGTARPETKFLDKTIIVHPDDKRYKNLIGKKMKVPWINGEVEANVIADRAADMKFGTGAMTITPAHSFVDFELAQKYHLPIVEIIDKTGRLTKATGEFAGMKAKEAREKIVEKLKEKGLLEKIDENYEHNLSACYRCGTPVEPLVSNQWFVKMKPLVKPALEAVKKGKIKIVPKRFEKIYFHWLLSVRDWCISRQLWWGHRIPVWYKNKETYVDQKAPKGEGWFQDNDVLDTWFSSALWPFSTLGWPKKTKDYEYFYPTSLMETGYDILFFWVARMIIMGIELTKNIPFKKIYLHGLVRDEHNRKMSKSLGNVIDPVDVIEKYGTDAVRMSLVVGATPGNDIAVGENKIKGYRNFSNKIWNIARFVMLNIDNPEKLPQNPAYNKNDSADLKRLDEITKETTKLLNNLQFSRAGELLYHFVWHEFADKIIEEAKPRLQSANENDKKAAAKKLYHILITSLKLLHPFMPFITEEIWQKIPGLKKEPLIISKWPDISS